MTVDNPLVRADVTCPLCLGRKAQGIVACWPCYRERNLRNGCRDAEDIIARREQYLANGRAWLAASR